MRLALADWEVAVDPACGAIDAVLWRGEEILHSTANPHSATPFDRAAFVMAPFVGRIGNGRFAFAGHEHQLRQNFPPGPHAIHGTAWTGAWTTTAHSPSEGELVYTDQGDDWPWRFSVKQRLKLSETGFEIALTLTNLSNEIMPAGLGWHPYFPKAQAEMVAPISGIWRVDPDKLPTKRESIAPDCDITQWRKLSDLDLDNPLAIEGDTIALRWPDRNLSATMKVSSVLSYLVLYTPPEEDFFCVEPVTHVPNAVNMERHGEAGLRDLEPGGTVCATVLIAAEAA